MKFSGRFKSRLEANVGIGGCVSSIALYLGYSETSAFSRHFKNFTGLSPSQFRCGRAAVNESSHKVWLSLS